MTTGATPRYADLVLEGGGVKGIALVGAATALTEHGYTFARIAGSSAGALVGSIIAAMQLRGESMSRVDDIMRTIDYTQMLDRRRAAKWLSWWRNGANAWGILFHLGMYRGHYLTTWTRGVLKDLGVETFGDLYFDDPESSLAPELSYRLVVTSTDLSRQRLLYLPWDLPSYNVDADGFSVARAVRASSAIPFLFEPVRMTSTYGKSTLADGSLLRSYPIDIFDRTDGKPSRWPTIGVRLSSLVSERAPAKPVTGPLTMVESLIYTTVDSTQVRHVNKPLDQERSIFAKPHGVRWTDFDLTPEQQQSLFESGYDAGHKWLAKFPDGVDPEIGTGRSAGQIDV